MREPKYANEMEYNILYSTLILVGCTLLVLPLKFWTFDGSDAWSHIYDSKQYKSWTKIPRSAPGFYPEPEFSYPWAVSWLLYVFKPKDAKYFGIILNVSIFILEILVGAIFLAKFIGNEISTIYAILRLINPLNFTPWSGIYGLNARVIGSSSINLLVLIMPLILYSNEWQVLYLLMIPILAICILASQFAVQALILIIVTEIIILHSGYYIMGAVASYALLLIITRGRVLEVSIGHFRHLIFYSKFLQFNSITLTQRVENLLEWILNFPTRTWKNRIYKLVWVPELRVFLWNPTLPIGLLLLCVHDVSTSPFSDLLALHEWTVYLLSSVVIVPIVNLKFLRFLGEPDRYFTFVSQSAAAAIVSFFVVTTNISSVVITSLYAVIAVGISVMLIWKRSQIKHEESTHAENQIIQEIHNHRKEKQTNTLVLVNPANRCDKFACLSNFKFFTIHTNVTKDANQWRKYEALFEPGYPYINIDALKYLHLEAHFYIECKRFLSDQYTKRHLINLDDFSVESSANLIFENNYYRLFLIKNAKT